MKRLLICVPVVLILIVMSGCAYSSRNTVSDIPERWVHTADGAWVKGTLLPEGMMPSSPSTSAVVGVDGIAPPLEPKYDIHPFGPAQPGKYVLANPTNEGSKAASRSIKEEHWGFLYNRGPSPSEALAKSGDINLSESGGIQVGKTKWTWWDTVYTRVHNFISSIFWWVLAIGLVLLILLLLPQTSKITSIILKNIVGLFTPVVGWLQAHAAKNQEKVITRQRDEIIYGGEEFKAAILKNEVLTMEQKKIVLDLFISCHKGKQNGDTQAAVKKVVE